MAQRLWRILPTNHPNPLEDSIDRLTSWISPMIATAFAVIAANGLAFSSENAMYDDWEEYAANYCYVHRLVNPLDSASGEVYPSQISYFPWIPYFFILHSITFYLPNLFWRSLACNFAFDFEPMLRDLDDASNLTNEKRNEVIKREAKMLSLHLDFCSIYYLCKIPLTSIFYVLKKWVYVLTHLLQLYIVCTTIGEGNPFWVFRVIMHMVNSSSFVPSGFFPLLTWCSLPMTVDNDTVYVAMSCLLGINVLFEKMYVCLYLWLLVMFILSTFNALYYTIFLSSSTLRARIFYNLLSKEVPELEYARVKWFAKEYLETDGSLFILCARNSYGNFITQELLKEIYSLS